MWLDMRLAMLAQRPPDQAYASRGVWGLPPPRMPSLALRVGGRHQAKRPPSHPLVDYCEKRDFSQHTCYTQQGYFATSFGSSSGHPRESPWGPSVPPPPHTATYYAPQRSSSGRSMTAAGSEDINATRKRRDFTRRRMPRDLGAQLYSPFNQPARSRASRVVRRREQQFCHG